MALEGIQEILGSGENSIKMSRLQLRLQGIFPELKESEDEKIRKAILNYLTKMWGNSQDDVCGVHVEDAIAWLEKQGEERKITHEEICKSYGIPDIGEFSDGYHTFNGLYKQRMILFAVLVKTYKDRAWKSWKHEDGLDCFGGGWFIVGIDTPAGTYTYHYEAKDWDRFDCQVLQKAKHWDGHDEFDVERLFSLVSNANKDEVIRCLINGMKFYYEDNKEATWGTEKFPMKVKDILSWLEKQGNNPQKTSIWKHWKDGIAGNGEGEPIYLIKYGYTYSLSSCLCFECDYIELSELDKLLSEKQGDKEEPQLYKTEDGEVITYSESEGYKVVKPKFKVGDWITNGQYTRLIVGINSDWPYYMFKDGTSKRIKDIDKKYHLWTIQDAKDGDVLVTTFDEDNMIVMYHSRCTIDTINVHCCLDNKFTRANLGVFDVEDVKPATKEQRDLLFEEMHEAGYEWDAEKKELKKISQRMISAEAKEALYDKPAWSEEDERMLHTIIADFKGFIRDNTSTLESHFNECIDWLKSLKQRINVF